jgi:hypothetical protein
LVGGASRLPHTQSEDPEKDLSGRSLKTE